MHINHGVYGSPGRTERPNSPTTPNPAHRSIASLRELYAKKIKQGYRRVLIAPAAVRLSLDEVIPTERYGREVAAPELIQDFLSIAPGSSEETSLEDAIRAFYTAIGSPVRPLHFKRLARAGTATAAMPPLVASHLRTLAHGGVVTSPERAAVGYTVSADTVRLHVDRVEESLDHTTVAELQAALTAWLRLNPTPRKTNT
ncbi:hypothetical protein [Streptomyces sp. YGL11-2]|uniref:hypothetical protein n=1 Tax=Streptomyces sp. YGL11-2 TaxID=3414028 RepID=UPI003CF4ABD6